MIAFSLPEVHSLLCSMSVCHDGQEGEEERQSGQGEAGPGVPGVHRVAVVVVAAGEGRRESKD